MILVKFIVELQTSLIDYLVSKPSNASKMTEFRHIYQKIAIFKVFKNKNKNIEQIS